MSRAAAAALLAVVALAGCRDSTTDPVDAGPPPVTLDQARAERLACTFKAGAMPAETLATDAVRGDQMPIDHILLVMQENRSFDHLFSGLADAGARAAAPDASNPDGQGNPVVRFHQTDYCFADTEHSWSAEHLEWDEGKNDGFVVANGAGGARAMGYYDATDLPYYDALARSFATSDMHFCSLLGPTWPNRMYYFAATSWGRIRNRLPPVNDPHGHRYRDLFQALTKAGVSWKVYSQGVPSPIILLQSYVDYEDHFVSFDDYLADVAANTLPQVAWVEADFVHDVGQDDDHPPNDIQKGQAYLEEVLKPLMASPAWARSVLFLTYDENGGLYDSVPPPTACPPDDLPPDLEQGDPDAGFDRYGFRVPLIAISPYAKPGYISHEVSDHTSIVRFVEARFDLPALTARDANADALLDLFDFAHPQPAPQLPEVVVDPTQLEQCLARFPPQDGGFL